MQTACWRRSRTGPRRKAAMRPKSSSTCSGKRWRARRCRGTAKEVSREEADDSSPQRCGGHSADAGDVLARGDAGRVRRRLRIGGVIEDDDDKKHVEDDDKQG